ncbi:hypothetical protein [Parahaliea aestuarii]|uniref:BD-FAE-like domain-containing protein n=1 Tax=Parahaliea aestuarii TaxID=1852021 RepID=A0A5C8ZYE9_9GAMM|nr:hypothetical protein [Parahaliea aestuarii]TXS92281.1 hypothetical protein FVW59_07600 [Parahaliea aestuarii]
MTYFTRIALLLTCSTLFACSDSGDSHNNTPVTPPEPSEPPRPALALTYSEAPIALDGINAEFAADVSYGDKERNVFDIYLPRDCDDPTPLVIYIHGGGFTGGDKGSAHENFGNDIREFLQNCVAYASINYTLLEVPDADGDIVAAAEQGGVLTSMQDSARALQFMRYYFDSLNLDVDNVALYGGSAGAGTALWLGTHDDMADPEAGDPVLRESTRVSAVGALATQATYDLIDWTDILAPVIEPFAALLGGTDIVTVSQAIGTENYLLTFLGATSVDELESQANIDYRANIDMLELMDAGDAPIYVHNYETSPDDLLNLFLHHGLHAIAVHDRAVEVGLESVGYSEQPGFILQDPSGEDHVSFLMRHIR